jgi:AraC-like DNA-binding protein
MKPTLLRPRMHFWRIKPDRRLWPAVLCYFVAQPIDSPSACSDEICFDEELILPDGQSEIVFNLGDGYERWNVAAPDKRAIMRSSYVIGGRSHSVVTRDLGRVHVAGAKLGPSFLHRLLGVPLDGFRDTTVTLSEVGSALLSELEAKIAASRSAHSVAALLDEFFLRSPAIGVRVHNAEGALRRSIHASQGMLPIMKWAKDNKLDLRRLERRFCSSTGMTPKRYARIVRFNHHYHRIITFGQARAALHTDAYYDESHFNKEFRFFMGVNPKAWMTGSMRRGTSVSDHLLSGELSRG